MTHDEFFKNSKYLTLSIIHGTSLSVGAAEVRMSVALDGNEILTGNRVSKLICNLFVRNNLNSRIKPIFFGIFDNIYED